MSIAHKRCIQARQQEGTMERQTTTNELPKLSYSSPTLQFEEEANPSRADSRRSHFFDVTDRERSRSCCVQPGLSGRRQDQKVQPRKIQTSKSGRRSVHSCLLFATTPTVRDAKSSYIYYHCTLDSGELRGAVAIDPLLPC